LHNSIFQQLRLVISPLAFLYALVELNNLKQKLLRDVVFIASPVDVQTPMGNRYFPDKLEGVIKVVENRKLSFLCVFHLFSISRKLEKKSDFKRLEILIPLIIFSHPIAIMRNYKIIKDEFQCQRLTTMKQRFRASLWVSLFLLVKPKIIFGIGMDQVILSACKRMGIETIEVMHGLFNSEKLPFSFKIETETVKPDLFLSWHEDFTTILRKIGISAITVGYPNTFLHKYNAADKKLEDYKILVTLGWRGVDCVDPNGTMTPELYDYLKQLPSKVLTFRMHPVSCNSRKQILQITKWLKKEFPFCSLASPFDESLLESLANCSYHVSHKSSTFFEASLLGKTTLLVELREKFSIPIPEDINRLKLLQFDKTTFEEKFYNRNELASYQKFKAPFKKTVIEKILAASSLID